MTYFQIQNGNGERIGETNYFQGGLAVAAAKRLAGKWRKDNAKRGSGIKVVCIDSNAGIWDKPAVVQWVWAE